MDDIIKWHHSAQSGFARHYLTLYSLVLGLEAKKVFEFGSGFSSKVILEALKYTSGKLITADLRSINETGNSAEDLLKNPNWRYIQGNSLNILKELSDVGFDLVLHDGSHEWRVVLRDLRFIIPRMKKNGIILIHDTFHKTKNFRLTWAVWLAFLFIPHESITLPYGYGLTIIRLKRGYGHGEILTSWEKRKKQ